MKTKLIQELVGLCVEKKTDFVLDIDGDRILLLYDYPKGVYSLTVNLDESNAPQQLQAAIDRIKGL